MKKNLIIISVLQFAVLANAQVNQEWTARYNGPSNYHDEGRYMAVDASGNVYVTGYVKKPTGFQFTDISTIKYNSAGIQQWASIYNGGGNPDSTFDYPSGIVVDVSGNVYVTGTCGNDEPPNLHKNFATIKYNSSGVQQWVRTYSSVPNNLNYSYGIALDNASNVYVTGAAGNEYTTIKYNSSGVQQWIATYVSPGVNGGYAYAIKVDNSGNVFITGSSSGVGTNYDIATIKYNSSGVQQWVTRYNGPGNNADDGRAIVLDNSGNIYVTGSSWGGASTNFDYITIKYNSSGGMLWFPRYNGPGFSTDMANSIAVDNSGNVYVTGYSLGSGTSYDYATIQYNSSGAQVWVQRYDFGPGGNRDDRAFSLALDLSGNVYVTGWSSSSTFNDYATIKYNSSGVQQWLMRYNGTGSYNDDANSIVVDNLNNVYVTGSSWGANNEDYVTIKYSQPIGLRNISNEVPDEFSLFQNYPNPFNPSTKIRFDVPSSRTLSGAKGLTVQLKVFDILGREIQTLVNEQLQPGSYEVEWNAGNYPGGVYYYSLVTKSFKESKKMVLVK